MLHWAEMGLKESGKFSRIYWLSDLQIMDVFEQFKDKHLLFAYHGNPKALLGPYQTSMMELFFTKVVYGHNPLTIFANVLRLIGS